jgi:hypothetical protein
MGLLPVVSGAATLPYVLHSDTFEAGDSQSWSIPHYNPSSPTVVGPVNLLTNNALFFDGGDQVQYLIPEEWQTGTFSVEFDLVLASMGSHFRVFVDSPTVQTLHFDATDGTQIYTTYEGGGLPDEYTTIGSYAFNTAMHVEFLFDIPAENWQIRINDALLYDDVMYGTSFYSLRFATTGAQAFVDNIVVSTVPIPAAVWLFGSALAGLGWIRRKQTV